LIDGLIACGPFLKHDLLEFLTPNLDSMPTK
jgi:hypothetical protein